MMERGGWIVRCGSASGAVAGSAVAIFRAATTDGLLAIYGWRGWLDLPVLVVAGAIAGALLGFGVAVVARRRAADGASRRGPRIGWVTALLLALATGAFQLELARTDPTATPRKPFPTKPRPPDVVVVIYDAVRADVVTDETGGIASWAPNLKRLAARSVDFRQALSPAPWTVPSHASLFSGLSPLDHGAMDESPRLVDEIVTLAESLHDRGYRTVGIVANPWLAKERGFAQGFDSYLEVWRLTRNETMPLWFRMLGRFERDGAFEVDDPRQDKGIRLASTAASHVIDQLDPDEPLFLFINVIDAHPPYWAPPSHRLKLVPPELLAKGIDPAKVPKHWVGVFTGKEVLTDDQRAVLRGLNMSEVEYMDGYLGRVLDSLERRGRARDAFIAVTADHGAGLGEERMIGSGFDLRESMLRIPMVVHFPGDRNAGTTRDDLVFLHDLNPTIIELARDPSSPAPDPTRELEPATREGRSLFSATPRVAGLAAYSRPTYMIDYLKSAFPTFDASSLDRLLTAIRGPRWKLIASSTGKDALYDMTAKGESEDLAEREPELCKQQRGLLERIAGGDLAAVWRRCIDAALSRSSPRDAIDAESREHLRRLGYAVGGAEGPVDGSGSGNR